MKKVVLVIIGAVILIVAINAAKGSGSDGKPPTSGSQQQDTAGNQSSELDAITSAPQWSPFAAKCTEGAIQLAGEVQAAYADLQRHQLTETYPQLVSHLNRSLPASAAPTRCADIIAAYLVLREPA